MGKIVLFLAQQEMVAEAMQLLQNKTYDIDIVKQVDTINVVEAARKAVDEGADVIIARGNQVMYIKQHLTVPVVDIRITAQELGILINKAKMLAEKERPKIAIIINRNMLPDTAHLGALYGVDIEIYTIYPEADVRLFIRKIADRKPDVIIGGSNVMVEEAGQYGIKTVHIALTQDGLREAFRVAEMMKYAIDVEKKSNAQIKALLDNSFTGILRTDRNGRITTINTFFMTMLRKKEREIVGRKIQQVFPSIEEQEIMRVLATGQAVYSTHGIMDENTVNFMMVPIIVGEEVEGVMLFCCQVQKNIRSSYHDHGESQSTERNYFEKILSCSPKMQQCIHRAKSYLQSRNPLLLVGEEGTEKKELAHAIYMSSMNRYGPLICIDCRNLTEAEQLKVIFGRPSEKNYESAVKRAQSGVLLLLNIEYLGMWSQARLFDAITYNHLLDDEEKPVLLNSRIIATGTSKLKTLAEGGQYHSGLYYTLAGLMLYIPPLRERKEDLTKALDDCFELYKNKYLRFFTLTKGARNYMLGYPWYGNLTQLKHFCEKLILTSDSRLIDAKSVMELMGEIEIVTGLGPSTPIKIEVDSDKEQIIKLLEKHHGNRQDVANELGISKVTLWRRMSKYDIQ